jgi:hypothetical protein
MDANFQHDTTTVIAQCLKSDHERSIKRGTMVLLIRVRCEVEFSQMCMELSANTGHAYVCGCSGIRQIWLTVPVRCTVASITESA